MQNLQTLAGVRGWPWRVERVETFERAARARLLHLARPDGAGTATLAALRPFEPMSRLETGDALRPMDARAAAVIVAAAAAGMRRTFAVHAADRLRGDIHEWQLAPALAFERGHARVLVADDAGMGKTVSAALAIAQVLDRASDRRCLVLAPAHLLAQWHAELHERLDIDALIVDSAGIERLQREIPAGLSVWSLPGCLLASIDFLKQSHILRSLETAIWDLLVVDEAHLACGLSERQNAAQMIARRARRVLLLTATPSDGGSDRLGALLSLGAANDAEPIVWLRRVATSKRTIERRLFVAPAPATRALHDALAAYTAWIASGPRLDAPAVSLLCSLLVKRALSSAHALHISLVRRLSLLGRDPEETQPSLFETEEDPGVIGAGTGLPLDRERRRLESLIDLAWHAAREDRRLHALVRLVRRTRETIVIFSCFRDTALLIANTLAGEATVRIVHGQLPQAAIDSALQAFTRGPARVLVATDVAAQGLNLHQRCRWVLHYDLPWRPPTIRQRLGRVDRLGQMRTAHATFLLDRTALSQQMLDRMTALMVRMTDDERVSARRWDVVSAAEATRVIRSSSHQVTDRQMAAGAAAVNACTSLAGPVTVVAIDCADAAGMSVERSVVAVRAPESVAVAWARWQGARRQSALRRRLATRVARRIAREHAVAQAALETVVSSFQQDGLFERRADRMRSSSAETRARVIASNRDEIARHASEGSIRDVRVRVIATFVKA